MLFFVFSNNLLFADYNNIDYNNIKAQKILKKYNKYDYIFQKVEKKYCLPWFLLKVIAITENSKLNPKLVLKNKNGTYDIGLMQVNSSWIKKLKKIFPQISFNKLKQPYFNVQVGAFILKKYIDKYGYSWKSVSYYHSFTQEYRKKWLQRIKSNIRFLAKYDKRIIIVSSEKRKRN